MALPSNQKMENKTYLPIIIVVLILLVVSVVISVVLNGKVSALSASNAVLSANNNKLNEENVALTTKITDYLNAEGRNCEKGIAECLSDITTQLKTVAGSDCSNIQDDVCPKWCGPVADYDCCVEIGHEWVPGRGCYPKD